MVTSSPSTAPPARRRLPGLHQSGLETGGPPAPTLLPAEPGVRPITIPRGWSRVGRSRAAQIRLADPSVSRRHALIVREADGGLQIIDDRSLSGTYVNGEPVQWAQLHDGDQLTIGSVRLGVREAAAPPLARAS